MGASRRRSEASQHGGSEGIAKGAKLAKARSIKPRPHDRPIENASPASGVARPERAADRVLDGARREHDSDGISLGEFGAFGGPSDHAISRGWRKRSEDADDAMIDER